MRRNSSIVLSISRGTGRCKPAANPVTRPLPFAEETQNSSVSRVTGSAHAPSIFLLQPSGYLRYSIREMQVVSSWSHFAKMVLNEPRPSH